MEASSIRRSPLPRCPIGLRDGVPRHAAQPAAAQCLRTRASVLADPATLPARHGSVATDFFIQRDAQAPIRPLTRPAKNDRRAHPRDRARQPSSGPRTSRASRPSPRWGSARRTSSRWRKMAASTDSREGRAEVSGRAATGPSGPISRPSRAGLGSWRSPSWARPTRPSWDHRTAGSTPSTPIAGRVPAARSGTRRPRRSGPRAARNRRDVHVLRRCRRSPPRRRSPEFRAVAVLRSRSVHRLADRGKPLHRGWLPIGAINTTASVDYTRKQVYFASLEFTAGRPSLWCLELTATASASPCWSQT